MEFKKFKQKLQENFAQLCNGAEKIFEVNVDKDALWNLYLDSFPPGTNEIYRERREYDCSACRHFIKNIGAAVFIKNNQVYSIWGFDTGSTTFQPVADALDRYVKSLPVSDVYVQQQGKVGIDQDRDRSRLNGDIITWDHLYLELPGNLVERRHLSEGEIKGRYRDVRNVFKRSLDEISVEAVETVMELINQNSLYRGAEWKAVLDEFLKYKNEYMLLPEEEKGNYAWEKSIKAGTTVGKIRNHSMGLLLIDISNGVNLDDSVRRYEYVVAPANYKRPKSIFTKKMLEDAQKTITELGYMDSLPRRFARLDDITVNNILFSNRDAAKRIAGSVFDEMVSDLPVDVKKFSRVEEISAEQFINQVLPTAHEVEVLLENKHIPNMVSLIAPVNADAPSMFKWNNPFGWAYSGNMTDSDITERVRAAGGRTDGALRFSHSWNYEGMRNASLMDLHVFMPGSNQSVIIKDKKEIHDNYGCSERVGWNNRKHFASGGVQDVDYTLPAQEGYIPVENTVFPSIKKLKEGIYTFKIHNWKFRHPTVGGFKAELAFNGQVYRFVRKEPLQHKEWVTLAKLELKNGVFNIIEMMENDTTPVEVWGLKTNQFVPVSVVMFSPNYWDEQAGNGHKHYFFMLKDCVNPERPNGMYNEFLKNELLEHKRVFEALGSKLAVQDVEDQLSGVGFSSTKRGELIVKVKGATERTLKVKF